MAYSVKNSAVVKVAGLSVAMLLAGCSHDQHYKREVNGNEEYLDAPALSQMNVPQGMILPLESANYAVPQGRAQGAVGKQLDIRPPVQALSLLNGSRAQFQGTTGMLQIANTGSSLWGQTVAALQANKFAIAQQDDARQQLTTDWISWNRQDEDHQYRGRYQVAVVAQGYEQTLMVKPIALEHKGQAVTSNTEIQRYTAQLLNDISAQLNTAETDRLNAAAANRAGSVDVQSGADETGLPNLIVRAPFDVTWQRLPKALPLAGMTISDSNRADGSLQLSYSDLSSSQWAALGAKDPELAEGKYKLQVGDLDNRSSLQFIDPKGHILTQSQNDALVAVLQAAFNK
ncbi:outer membrane protein assembly factor BamC [Rosenbergiella epipactidis]|uniref:outer membrane protein assembly factor BamC n=1 Tax=Rosenbergiella epipactidis TaxID=1544694 RepID=UPI001F4E94A9|nr:outer membrane protein assembly factor BamC [Rosenbergiella epipactidis]